jgi:hypothetical protein
MVNIETSSTHADSVEKIRISMLKIYQNSIYEVEIPVGSSGGGDEVQTASTATPKAFEESIVVQRR